MRDRGVFTSSSLQLKKQAGSFPNSFYQGPSGIMLSSLRQRCSDNSIEILLLKIKRMLYRAQVGRKVGTSCVRL